VLGGTKLYRVCRLPKINQCLVWLDGLDGHFFVPFGSPSGGNTIEMKIVNLIIQCFDRQRNVTGLILSVRSRELHLRCMRK
jgi:hypothetical protein